MYARLIGANKAINRFVRDNAITKEDMREKAPFKAMLTVDIQSGEVLHDERKDRYWSVK